MVHQVLAIVYVSYGNGFKSAVITRMNLVKTKNTYGSQSWNKLVILEEGKNKQQNKDVSALFQNYWKASCQDNPQK